VGTGIGGKGKGLLLVETGIALYSVYLGGFTSPGSRFQVKLGLTVLIIIFGITVLICIPKKLKKIGIPKNRN
jgi:hypothetical protein